MRERDVIPREEQLVRILYGLVNVETGQKIGKSIADTILTNPSIRRVVVVGEPGVHKSTVIENLAYELKRRGKILSGFIFYDDVLAQTERQLGSREGWSDDGWHELSRNMLKAIGQTVDTSQEQRQVQIVEIMGMSKEGGKDRAVTALQTLAEQSRDEDPDELSTIFVAIAPTSKSQRKTMMLRRAIQHVEARDVLSFLDNEFNMFYIGARALARKLARETDKKSSYYIELFGRNMKKRFQRMGAADKITQVHDEILSDAQRLMDNPENFKKALEIAIPSSSYGLDARDQDMERVVAFHLVHKLRTQLGLTPDRAFVVLSTFLEDKIYYHVDEKDFREEDNI